MRNYQQEMQQLQTRMNSGQGDPARQNRRMQFLQNQWTNQGQNNWPFNPQKPPTPTMPPPAPQGQGNPPWQQGPMQPSGQGGMPNDLMYRGAPQNGFYGGQPPRGPFAPPQIDTRGLTADMMKNPSQYMQQMQQAQMMKNQRGPLAQRDPRLLANPAYTSSQSFSQAASMPGGNVLAAPVGIMSQPPKYSM